LKTQVQKWGNSLALRIPKSFAKESQIAQGSVVEVSLDNGKIVVQALSEPEFTLEELLARVTKENLHDEIESGGPVGREVW
jgi:antitoxin MazE